MKVLLIGSVPEIDEILSQQCTTMDLVVTSSKFSRCVMLPYYQNIFSIDDETSDTQMTKIVSELQSTHHYNHILTFTDKWQLVVYEITQLLNMECAIEPGPVSRCRDKKKFRDLMQKAGLSLVWHSEAILSNLQEQAANHKFPYVIKPRTGQGSVGVKVIRSKKDFNEFISELPSIDCNELLIEGYADGPEFSVEAFSLNGRHNILAITKKYKFNNTVVESGHSIPANLSTDVEAEISAYVVNILNELGLNNGPSHTEIIYTVRGPVVIESHCRIGGDKISQLVKLATGVDYCRLVVDNALQRSIELSCLEKTRSYFTSVRFIAIEDEQTGFFKGVGGAQEVIECEHVIEMKVMKTAGDKIKKVACSGDRIAYVMFGSRQPIPSDIEVAVNKLKILFK